MSIDGDTKTFRLLPIAIAAAAVVIKQKSNAADETDININLQSASIDLGWISTSVFSDTIGAGKKEKMFNIILTNCVIIDDRKNEFKYTLFSTYCKIW